MGAGGGKLYRLVTGSIQLGQFDRWGAAQHVEFDLPVEGPLKRSLADAK